MEKKCIFMSIVNNVQVCLNINRLGNILCDEKNCEYKEVNYGYN